MPRLGHKKSRNGCRQCKARHVKCDESKPCSSCTRHGVPCSLVTDAWNPDEFPQASGYAQGPTPESSFAPNSVGRRSGERSRSRSRTRRSSSTSIRVNEEILNPTPATSGGTEEAPSPASSTDTFPFLTKITHRRDASEHEHWARDLELLHHWTTEACISMVPSTRDDVKRTWSVLAPKEAVRNTYLMHQMLTFSALHLAHHQPLERSEYHALAIHHQDLAIKAMRPQLHNIVPENAPLLFATSTLISMCCFGERSLSAMSPGGKEPLEDLLDAFALLQGMGTLFGNSYILVFQSPFAPIISPGTVTVPPQPIFALLIERIPEAVSFIGAQTDIPEDVQRESLVQLLALKDILVHNSNPTQDSREMRSLFFWPLHLAGNFAYWVRERRQPVLLCLAFYAVALRAAETKYWFYNGWAERLMRAVGEAMEPSWQPAVQWQWDFIMGTGQTPQNVGHGLDGEMDMGI